MSVRCSPIRTPNLLGEIVPLKNNKAPMSTEQRKIRHNELNAVWRAKNPDYFKRYAEDHKEVLLQYYRDYGKELRATDPEKLNQRSRNRRYRVKMQVIGILGGQCASPDCRFLNFDMTLGCKDPRVLEVDHINGGGRKEVEKIGYHVMMRSIIEKGHQGKYQLLCRDCNHLKRIKNGEHGKGKPSEFNSSGRCQ
jgi:hypothetical protein